MDDSHDPRRRRLLAGAAAAMLATALPARAERTLRFGTTPVFLDEQARFLTAWQAWLQKRLERPVRFVQRASYREIVENLLSGRIEAAWLCGYPYTRHKRELELVAVPRYQGAPRYRSYLIVPAEDAHTRSIADLRGRVFAYSDPDSNSGWLVSQSELARIGATSDRFFRKTFFTWSHRRVIEACAAGLAQGGAVDGYIWDTLARQHPELTQQTRVAWRSAEFGFPPVVAGPAMRAGDRTALAAALRNMGGDAAGRALLADLNLDGFVAGRPDAFDSIEHAWRALGL